jgi:UDP-glucose 4-epimerase
MTAALVTGGCGFVGCNLVEPLRAAGYEPIIVFDNESIGSRHELDDLSSVDFVHGDLRDPAAVDAVVARADAIVHLAAETRVIESIDDPQTNFDVNVVGTLNVLHAMRRHGKRRIVNASTGGAILGDVDPPVHEEMVPRPISPYGASKLAVEGYLSAFAGSYDLLPISFRFSNLYGPRSFHKGSVVAAFFKTFLRGDRLPVYGDGTQTRDLLYVEDLSDVIVGALSDDTSGVFQLGTGRPVSLNELIGEMSHVVGTDLAERVDYLPARRGEVLHNYCDISLARERLGFDPRTELRAGLSSTWSWFETNAGRGDADQRSSDA